MTIVPHSLPVDGVSGNPKSNGSMPGHSDALSSFDGTSASGQATGATASTLNGVCVVCLSCHVPSPCILQCITLSSLT